MKFYGYRRADGSVGCRNLVAVIPSVVCAADVAQAIVQNVQGAVGLFHHQGCSQLPPDLKRVTDTLIGLALNPNVGAGLRGNGLCENVPGDPGGRKAGGDHRNPEAGRCQQGYCGRY